ncbi:hypothetical protein LMG19282_00245 [Cupriavidus campinensis]|uniref:ATP-binding protein n=1 Tax=Cupriavidus campinensis TaxID=151783 RepID=UPI001B2C7D8F|nr:ATP-binding protein [Cupriavidus campinensis]CAG2129873.1 hypothetical protein LMG19282_00245 [Cupriavidus campinensis]
MFKRNKQYIHPELDAILTASKRKREEWFSQLNISHLNLSSALQGVLDCVRRNNNTRFIFLIGMSGAGKTNLATNALADAFTELWGNGEGSEKPFIYIAVENNDKHNFAWKNLFGDIMEEASAVPTEYIRETSETGGIIRYANNSRLTLSALRKSIKRMAKERALKVIIFDEAYYFLRFNNRDVMNTSKSFAEQIDIKLIFIGSYELLELSMLYTTQIRRTEVVPFFRYDTNNESEMEEFKVAVEKFATNWPCKSIPNFVAAVKDLADSSMGGVGQLSVILSNFLGYQLRAKSEMWTSDMFGKSLKASTLNDAMRQQIITGEAELRRKYGVKNYYCTDEGIAAIGKKLAR